MAGTPQHAGTKQQKAPCPDAAGPSRSDALLIPRIRPESGFLTAAAAVLPAWLLARHGQRLLRTREEWVPGHSGDAILRRICGWMEDRRNASSGGVAMLVNMDRYVETTAMLHPGQSGSLLQQIAMRMKDVVDAAGGCAGRFSRDEFLAFVPGRQGQEPERLAERLHASLSRPYDVQGQPFLASFGISLALFPEHGRSIERLLRGLQIAMVDLKARSAGGGWQTFDSGMIASNRDRQALEQDLRQAVAQGRYADFLLHYQPICDGATGRVMGCEALLRWNHPTRGLLGPAGFLDHAESTGLIVPLGDWVLEEACAQAASWPVNWRVHVNLSVRQMMAGDLPERVRAILRRTGLEPSRLVLEVTESMCIGHYEGHARMLEGMRSEGVGIALDDFGAGYCSLNHLHSLPFDWIKLDRLFVADLESNRNSRAVVSALLALSRALGRSVIAEGVETHGQREILEKLGCRAVQGYLLGRPVPADRIAALAVQAAPMQ